MSRTIRKIIVEKTTAELEVDKWLTEMDVEPGEGEQESLSRVIRAVMYGDLVFNDEGEAVYTPWRKASKHKDPLTFRERTGADLIDSKATQSKAEQAYRVMGALTGTSAATISGLSGADIKTCEALLELLMV